MALPEVQQAISILNRSKNILLIVPEKPSADAFASMLALYLTLLKKTQGMIDCMSPSHVPQNLQFLPGSSQVQMHIKKQPSATIDIAGPESVVDIRTESLQGGIRLHITFDDNTTLTKDQIETSIRQLPYDIVVIFGASDLEDLGNLFTDHADFFYNTPIINIDNKANNEHYGTVNIVDITLSSIAEVTYELVRTIESENLDPDLATVLYAGIVAATESFQKPSTTPHAFELAADLMKRKADKESVIQHLVKTKPLELLKLTGRTYARLRHDEHGKLFWSLLRKMDFTESQASHEMIPDIMYELTHNISGFNAAFLLFEKEPGTYTAYLTIGKGLKKRQKEIQQQLGAVRQNGALNLPITASSLEEAEVLALEKVRSILP